MSDGPPLPCPACGFRVITDANYGSYTMCEICWWEDDAVQLANPASRGGANGESLIEAQERALRAVPMAVTEARGFHRDPRWRPLTPTEQARATEDSKESLWGRGAVVDLSATYWMRDSSNDA